MDSMIDDYLCTSMQHAAKTGQTASGGSTFAAATDIMGKIFYKEEMFESPNDGSQKVSRAQVVINPSLSVTVGDRITISGVNYFVGFVGEGTLLEELDNKKLLLVF